jgi:hypothetical protein
LGFFIIADVRSLAETLRIKLPGRPLSLALSRDGQVAYLGVQWHSREGRKTFLLEWSKTFANLVGMRQR